MSKPTFSGTHSHLKLTDGDLQAYWRLAQNGIGLICVRDIPDTSKFWQKSNADYKVLAFEIMFDTREEVNALTPGVNADMLRKFMAEALRDEKKWKELNNDK